MTKDTFQFVETNSIRLRVWSEGPADGPLLILLHGFPEYGGAWKKQLRHFAERGFRVLAPDQRGYGLSDKPRAVSRYRIEELGQDILGLIEREKRERAAIVGHDWGGVVTWWLAAQHPERVSKAVILNVPHPRAFARQLRRDPEQRRRSRYMLSFQLPLLPELKLSRRRFSALQASLVKTANPGTFSDEELRGYLDAWSQPRALTSMLNWYRAMGRAALLGRLGRERKEIQIPLMLIWGARDPFLDRAMAEPSLRYCRAGRLEWIADGTHWVHHEHPERVSALIEGFLA